MIGIGIIIEVVFDEESRVPGIHDRIMTRDIGAFGIKGGCLRRSLIFRLHVSSLHLRVE
jgi:hypothetical protein